jgi:hypothetical protein
MAPTSSQELVIECRCGQKYFATTRQIGKSLRCSCGVILAIEAPKASVSPPSPPKVNLAANRRASPALVVAGCIVIALCVLGLERQVRYSQRAMAQIQARAQEERTAARLQHEVTASEEQKASAQEIENQRSAFQAQLTDPELISGAKARQLHESEWASRLAHDPKIAKSVMERTLLKMEKTGRDPQLSAQKALEEVATLAAPPRSRVQVLPSGDGFSVKVAFRMSALTGNETGAVTKHHDTESMRREIEDLSARVMIALFDYCGSRGIESLSVSCNHAMRQTLIPLNASSTERDQLLSRASVVMGRLYRVSVDRQRVSTISSWRKIYPAKLIGMMTVEKDNLQTLQISGTTALAETDPQGELEF